MRKHGYFGIGIIDAKISINYGNDHHVKTQLKNS
jgi:hypothetical protein